MRRLIPNTFGLPVTARRIVTAKTPASLCRYWQKAQENNDPVIILGYGSNTLFTTDFSGTIINNRIMDIAIHETDSHYLLRVGAGMLWHDLVKLTLAAGQYGLENLAMIPGSVGSAAIQNIGAYGTEFKQFADYVEIVELETGKRMTVLDGEYGYRDSIFKHAYRDGFAVLYVGLKLPKAWQPAVTYGDLQKLAKTQPSPQKIFNLVCKTRQRKLPNPDLIGNGGSFFKNPTVSPNLAKKISQRYPGMPSYPQPNGGIKLAAGWLIEQCDLKGYEIGGAAVHTNQALVIINKHNATPDDIVNLASHVRQKVSDKFRINLEPEIRFIGAESELEAVRLLANIEPKDRSCEA